MNLQALSCSFGCASCVSLASHRTSFQRSSIIRAKSEPSEKSIEIMRKFSEQYARKSGTYFCVDKGVTSFFDVADTMMTKLLRLDKGFGTALVSQ